MATIRKLHATTAVLGALYGSALYADEVSAPATATEAVSASQATEVPTGDNTTDAATEGTTGDDTADVVTANTENIKELEAVTVTGRGQTRQVTGITK
ncbi:MAG: hypothetical protein ACKN9T_05055, partial [Candidatus Methylumidiphilus sp.]